MGHLVLLKVDLSLSSETILSIASQIVKVGTWVRKAGSVSKYQKLLPRLICLCANQAPLARVQEQLRLWKIHLLLFRQL